MDAETYRLSLSGIEGKFEGIGAQVTSSEDGQLTIIAPIPDSPADKAGIRAGDVILEVDGEPTSEMSLAEAVLKVRGTLGTPVTLLVLHEGETEPVEIEIVRAEINLPSVRFEMMDDIAYINITYFSDRTSAELYPPMASIAQETVSGIILDLRSNPGGLLDAVVDVASYFLEKDSVIIVVDNKGERTTFTVESEGPITTNLPLVVLVDSYSASGSEVLAGALRDNGRAVIAGTTTYGKGSVNAMFQLSDGSAIYLTTARWLTPNGDLIEGKGLQPDYELNLEEQDAIEWAIEYLTNNQS
jgi:carboxyl-terminal processing protease